MNILIIYLTIIFKIENITIREKISRINNLISDHEEYLANPLLDFLEKDENFFNWKIKNCRIKIGLLQFLLFIRKGVRRSE